MSRLTRARERILALGRPEPVDIQLAMVGLNNSAIQRLERGLTPEEVVRRIEAERVSSRRAVTAILRDIPESKRPRVLAAITKHGYETAKKARQHFPEEDALDFSK